MVNVDIDSLLHAVAKRIDFTFHLEHLVCANHFRQQLIDALVIAGCSKCVQLTSNLITHAYGCHAFCCHTLTRWWFGLGPYLTHANGFGVYDAVS